MPEHRPRAGDCVGHDAHAHENRGNPPSRCAAATNPDAVWVPYDGAFTRCDREPDGFASEQSICYLPVADEPAGGKDSNDKRLIWGPIPFPLPNNRVSDLGCVIYCAGDDRAVANERVVGASLELRSPSMRAQRKLPVSNCEWVPSVVVPQGRLCGCDLLGIKRREPCIHLLDDLAALGHRFANTIPLQRDEERRCVDRAEDVFDGCL